MNQLIIDRFEEEWAIVEFGDKTFKLPKEILPPKVKEGDVLNLNFTLDKTATAKQLSRNQELLNELMQE